MGVDMTHAYTILIQRGLASLKMYHEWLLGNDSIRKPGLVSCNICVRAAVQLIAITHCKYRNALEWGEEVLKHIFTKTVTQDAWLDSQIN